MEDIEERHKVERKELQAKIQRIKHAVPKGDKKRQKEAKAEIAILEAEMAARHEQECQEVKTLHSEIKECEEVLSGVDISFEGRGTDSPKKSKTAKRREKKEREDKEREARIAQGLAESVNSARNVEQQKIDAILRQRNLKLFDIPSDGDCLYKALAHQISCRTGQPSFDVTEVRSKAAEAMRKSPDDYLPYLTTSDGNLLDGEGFNRYLESVAHTHEWGGQVEINALSVAFGYPIHIIQADMPDVVVDNTSTNDTKEPLILVYHRRLYELGEHYNSVTHM